MYYQLEFITKTQKPTLIIFVHGLVGGRHTWIRNDGKHSLLNYLYASPDLRAHNDFAVFSYYTKFSDLLSRVGHFVKRLFFKNTPQSHKNLGIDQVAGIFKSELEMQGYENVVLISHSMGGLVAKSLVLQLLREKQVHIEKETKLLEEKRPLQEREQRGWAMINDLQEENKQLLEKDMELLAADMAKLDAELQRLALEKNKLPAVQLYISLAVPHEGANLAIWGMLFFKSRQIANLSPLNKHRRSITQNWLKTPPALLPHTVYFKGNNDQVVSRASSEAFEIRDNIKVVETSDDHFSIVCPRNSDNIIVTRVKEELRRLQGITGTGANNTDLALPPLVHKTPRTALKPRWIAFIIATGLLAAAVFFLVKILPARHHEQLKDRVASQLGLQLYYVRDMQGGRYKLADYLATEDRQPDSVKGYTLHDFLKNFEHVWQDKTTRDFFSIDEKKDAQYYVLKFHPGGSREDAGFMIGLRNEFYDSLVYNGSHWYKDNEEKEFCKLLCTRPINDTTVIRIPESIIQK